MEKMPCRTPQKLTYVQYIEAESAQPAEASAVANASYGPTLGFREATITCLYLGGLNRHHQCN